MQQRNFDRSLEWSQGDEIQALQDASTSSSGWPADMRAGVVAVLRAQTHPWCRQEALAVAAAMVAFLGPAWLLGGPPLQVWARHHRRRLVCPVEAVLS